MSKNIATLIEVCIGLHCSMKGAYALLDAITEHYDLKIGVPSDDGMLIREIECMHDCRNSTIVFINGMEIENTSVENVIKYIDAIHVKSIL